MTKIKFTHSYESVLYFAAQNDEYCRDEAALRLFKQALGLAKTKEQKQYCQRRINLLEKENKEK